MKFTYTVAIGLMTVAIGLIGPPQSLQAKDDGREIAMREDVVGKTYVNWRGAQYTKEIYRNLISAGCEAYLVTYKWRYSYERPDHDQTWYMVVYRDADARYWAVDPGTTQPIWVSGKDPKQWISKLYPKLIASLVQYTTDSRFAGQYADRERMLAGSKPSLPIASKRVATQGQPSGRLAN